MKNNNEIFEKCHCLIINKGCKKGLFFENSKAIVKGNKVFGYDENKGEFKFYSINKSKFLLENGKGSRDELCHFVLNDKWGLFLFETGEIVVDPVWDFIGNLKIDRWKKRTRNLQHYQKTMTYHESVKGSRTENEEKKGVDALKNTYCFHVVKKREENGESKDLCPSAFFDEFGQQKFEDYYDYLEELEKVGAVQGVLCSTGEIVVPIEYDYLREITISRTPKYEQKKWHDFEIYNPKIVDEIKTRWGKSYKYRSDNLYLVKTNQKIGVISSCFRSGTSAAWDDIKIAGCFIEHDFLTFDMFTRQDELNPVILMLIRNGQKLGVIDLNGMEIIPVVYDSIEMVEFAERILFKVRSDGNEGLICLNKNILVPVKQQTIISLYFRNGQEKPEIGWNWRANYIICVEKTVIDSKKRLKYTIYNQFFKMVNPKEFGGLALIEPYVDNIIYQSEPESKISL